MLHSFPLWRGKITSIRGHRGSDWLFILLHCLPVLSMKCNEISLCFFSQFQVQQLRRHSKGEKWSLHEQRNIEDLSACGPAHRRDNRMLRPPPPQEGGALWSTQMCTPFARNVDEAATTMSNGVPFSEPIRRRFLYQHRFCWLGPLHRRVTCVGEGSPFGASTTCALHASRIREREKVRPSSRKERWSLFGVLLRYLKRRK